MTIMRFIRTLLVFLLWLAAMPTAILAASVWWLLVCMPIALWRCYRGEALHLPEPDAWVSWLSDAIKDLDPPAEPPATFAMPRVDAPFPKQTLNEIVAVQPTTAPNATEFKLRTEVSPGIQAWAEGLIRARTPITPNPPGIRGTVWEADLLEYLSMTAGEHKLRPLIAGLSSPHLYFYDNLRCGTAGFVLMDGNKIVERHTVLVG